MWREATEEFDIQGFSEEICGLMGGRDPFDTEQSLIEEILEMPKLGTHMFGSRSNARFIGDGNGSLIVFEHVAM